MRDMHVYLVEGVWGRKSLPSIFWKQRNKREPLPCVPFFSKRGKSVGDLRRGFFSFPIQKERVGLGR
jgi:hypothetical protein